MAVTRSSSAKKVVHKAVAVKVTKSSGRKYVSWDDTCNQLIAFWKKEGHCCPHFSTTLGKWCTKQRQKFQANDPQLSQNRTEKLSKLDFQFCLYNTKQKKRLTWDDRYEELVDYKKENGHANPLQREGQLGRWCINQRQLFQNQFRSTEKATLYQYQIDKLVDIGFLFNPPQGRRMLQRANLLAISELPAWPDMPALLLGRTRIWGRSGGETLDGIHVEYQNKALEQQDSELRCGESECPEREEQRSRSKSESSLILDYLTIQCHAFSVRIDVFST